jgi:hypothetical protein
MCLGPWDTKNSYTYAPATPRQGPAARPRRVLADSEVTGEEGLAWHELRDPGNTLGEDVHDGRQWNVTGDGEARRPCRVTDVTGEGLANRGN